MTVRSIADTTCCAYKPSELYSLLWHILEERQISPVLAKLTHGYCDSNCVDFI